MRATRLLTLAGLVTAVALWLPAAVRGEDTAPTALVLAGRTIATFRASAGGLGPAERCGIVQKRLDGIVATPTEDSDVKLAALDNGEESILVKGQLLVTVCAADADANRATPHGLAKVWAHNLCAALRAMNAAAAAPAASAAAVMEDKPTTKSEARKPAEHANAATEERPSEPAKPAEHATEPSRPAEHATEPARPAEHATEPARPAQHATEPARPPEHATEPARPAEHATAPTRPNGGNGRPDGPAPQGSHDRPSGGQRPAAMGNREQFHSGYRTQGNTTYVPMRDSFEQIGAQVEWDAGSNQGSIVYQGYTILCTVGSTTVIIIENGRRRTEVWDEAPMFIDGQLYLPMRDAFQDLGLAVDYQDGGITVGAGFYFSL